MWVYTVDHGKYTHDVNDVVRWQNGLSFSNTIQVLDCSDPDIRDRQTDEQFARNSVINITCETDYQLETHDLMWGTDTNNVVLNTCNETNFRSYRYEHVSKYANWLEAKEDAENRGGRLVVLDSQAKAEHFLIWLRENNITDKSHIGLDTYKYNPKWVNGDRVDVTISPKELWEMDGNWNTDKVNSGMSIRYVDGVVKTDDHAPGILLQHYIMEFRDEDQLTGEYTYHYIGGAMTFQEAREDARRRGGLLAVLRNSTDNANMNKAWSKAGEPQAWIGLSRNFDRGDGRYYDNTNGFVWDDGKYINEYGYRNWYPGEPNNFHEGGVHIGFFRSSDKWNDTIVNNRVHGYMLQLPVRYTDVEPSWGRTPGSPVRGPCYHLWYHTTQPKMVLNATWLALKMEHLQVMTNMMLHYMESMLTSMVMTRVS